MIEQNISPESVFQKQSKALSILKWAHFLQKNYILRNSLGTTDKTIDKYKPGAYEIQFEGYKKRYVKVRWSNPQEKINMIKLRQRAW